MKKSYTASFKAQAILELLKETKTLNQLYAEIGKLTTHVNFLKTKLPS